MKAVIVSLICRLLAYMSVLAFVFGIVTLSGNYNFLWLLLLLLTCEFVPTYQTKGDKNDRTDGEN